DPANGFLPSSGAVTWLRLPAGPGIRWDGGITIGTEVSLFYDPMLAKLIVWAPTRAEAIERMHRALLELTVEGVETSRIFHLRVMEDDEFRRGAIEIQWLERRLPSLTGARPPAELVRAAAIAAALSADRDRLVPRPAASGGAGAGVATPGPAASTWQRVARLDALR
ncbi:MAG TPA: acetyl-CoA carboxylase biotin carboxylase subunit, partial [Gemmatimonadaceae bacterium]|nr:acetyl-CoA carboxylase biotin carboxylase subunit [Gemmatimonadaceae bacterium]